MTNAARTARIVRALSCVATVAARLGISGGEVDPSVVAHVLRDAGGALRRGQSVSVAIRLRAASVCRSPWAHEALALDVIEALCGSLDAFDALSGDRRANVLRYAIASLTVEVPAATGWGPGSTVSDCHAEIVRIGVAWHEVAHLAAVRHVAAA